jgi:hypothetical protein
MAPHPATPPLSASVLAGRPGAIRALQTIRACHGGLAPQTVAVADAGIVQGNNEDQARIVRVTTGRTVRRFGGSHLQTLAVALDRKGDFAITTDLRRSVRCGHTLDAVSRISIGTLGHRAIRYVWTSPGSGYNELAIAEKKLAFLRATPGCPPTYHIAVAKPERAPKVLSGLKLYSSLDFNGRLIAAGGAGANLIQLERVN